MRKRTHPLSAVLYSASLFAAWATWPSPGDSAIVPPNFVDEVRVNMLDSPVGIAFLPDGRLLIAEQLTAEIRLARNGAAESLAVVPEVRAGGEEGLLGIAVDPRWPTKPFVSFHYTRADSPSTVVISRFELAGDLDFTGDGVLTLDVGTRYDLLTDIPNNKPIHNGGTVRFGPDDMLYVSLGEDGTACWAQDTTILSGKILRLDVSMLPGGPGGPPDKVLLAPTDNPFAAHPDTNARLVWAMGLRNPFRFQIDPVTGDLFITDVGRDAWEEVDLADQAGLNFGWPWYEGPDTLGTCDSGLASGFTEPIHAADHNLMVAGISAGLYRQNGGALQFPLQYEGDYFFADYYTGDLYRLNRLGSQWSIAPPVPGQPSPLAWATGLARAADFAIGPDGALWYCLQAPANRVHRIAYVGPAGVEPAPLPSADQDPVHYDLQGRRVDNPKRTGLYFTRRGAKRVVLN